MRLEKLQTIDLLYMCHVGLLYLPKTFSTSTLPPFV